jgi:excisionase family DNA binding protein
VESPVNEAREVMNLRQASTYLGVSPDTLYRYVSEGVVPAFKLGNRWKLRKSVLDRWMESKMSLPRQASQNGRSKKSAATAKLVTANSD